MSEAAIPFSVTCDLWTLPAPGAEIVLSPPDAALPAISAWLGIEALESLNATVLISREGENDYVCTGSFTADVVQACVVTLEPVRAHLTGEFRRLFRVLPRIHARRRKTAEPAAGIDIATLDEESELLESPVIDLAAPLLEEVSLALDPYPRAPNAAFHPPPEEPGPPDNPFAVLEQLKTATSGGARPGGKPEGRSKPESAEKKRR